MDKIIEQIIEVSKDLSHAIFMEEWQQVKSWGKQLECLLKALELIKQKNVSK